MDAIRLSGVKTHNLKNLDLVLPHNRLYVLTGVSGSGKSSLAFDTLYAEGQRRYVESLSAYARQFLERMEKPDVEFCSGIRPSIAIEAKNVITNARSTVGTQTEINDYLRLFFARAGMTICPDCGLEVRAHTPASSADTLLAQYPGERVRILFALKSTGKGNPLKTFFPELERQGFAEFFYEKKQFAASEIAKLKSLSSPVLVSVDDLVIQEKSRKRLTESLELAFKLGKGHAQVFLKDRQTSRDVLLSEEFRCSGCHRAFREPVPNLFSFNSPLGACEECQGFGRVITMDWDLVVPDVSKSIEAGAVEPWTKPSATWEKRQLIAFCRKKKISMSKPWKDLREEHRKWILFGMGEGARENDYFSVKDWFEYLEKKTYKMHVRILLARYRNFVPCPVCKETRLKPDALCVFVHGKNIHTLQTLSLKALQEFFKDLKLPAETASRVEPVLIEIRKRLEFLNEVGLGYLSLSRLSRTLSGGEVQRIHLATSLGSALVDTLYVLDEPSIGLHERDNQLLIGLLRKLRDLRNTVVVVEHDRTMIESADEVLDMGPVGGEQGGQLVFQGSVSGLKSHAASVTGRYLSGRETLDRRKKQIGKIRDWVQLKGAAEHNLQNVDVRIPLGRLTVISGVSGSGKSTLLYNVLYHHYLRFRGRPVQDVGRLQSAKGFEKIRDMVLIDQSPIGKSSRSNPATYLGAYDDIRQIFAKTPAAKRQGFEAGYFSFNVEGGRCPVCEGDGRVKVEMHFLADVYVLCESCQGKRFKPDVLEILYQGKNIDQVLSMSVDAAIEFFASEPKVVRKLSHLHDLGLGYLQLGQSVVTLSGGEAQRLKLASEMSEQAEGGLMYLFDEPTTGLHEHDLRDLVRAFDRLLEQGHSVVVIEHHMEMIRLADYVIDLGPEGGSEGGRIVYQGETAGLLRISGSYTGKYLKKYLDKIATSSDIYSAFKPIF